MSQHTPSIREDSTQRGGPATHRDTVYPSSPQEWPRGKAAEEKLAGCAGPLPSGRKARQGPSQSWARTLSASACPPFTTFLRGQFGDPRFWRARLGLSHFLTGALSGQRRRGHLPTGAPQCGQRGPDDPAVALPSPVPNLPVYQRPGASASPPPASRPLSAGAPRPSRLPPAPRGLPGAFQVTRDVSGFLRLSPWGRGAASR